MDRAGQTTLLLTGPTVEPPQVMGGANEPVLVGSVELQTLAPLDNGRPSDQEVLWKWSTSKAPSWITRRIWAP